MLESLVVSPFLLTRTRGSRSEQIGSHLTGITPKTPHCVHTENTEHRASYNEGEQHVCVHGEQQNTGLVYDEAAQRGDKDIRVTKKRGGGGIRVTRRERGSCIHCSDGFFSICQRTHHGLIKRVKLLMWGRYEGPTKIHVTRYVVRSGCYICHAPRSRGVMSGQQDALPNWQWSIRAKMEAY
ncbi:hypothetical protein F511_03646 [Dorcoceras hygrometricum]|uniref:Uncharacterized protein n=1 Tax=Dorcoceras hygrometricum TaxID=472368 RepID=A0A2Z7BD05_9LAMI|nr:hypothetical protein F511_03646 [Dorcoceras hygrometricum]